MTCPRHDLGRNHTHTTTTTKAPCGCLVTVTTLTTVTGRPVVDAPKVEPSGRCDAARPTAQHLGTCHKPSGHPGPHSWEKTQ